MCSAAVDTPSSSVSTETPCQTVSSFDHLVTQWMSAVTSSLGSARSSSHVQRRGSSTSPTIEKSHSSSDLCGVGPAERTGKSLVTYWPGGTRPAGASWRRPRKPREMSGGISRLQGLSEREGVGLGAGFEELDLKRPLAHGAGLAHELVHAA